MGTTFICEKCREAVRIWGESELTLFISEHKLKCDGKIESLWKNYDKMSNDERERLVKQVMWKSGKIGKITR